MRIYQGVDIVEISKFKNVCINNKDFVSDIFSEKEIEYCLSKRNPYIHLAGRFAAKEASLKALGTGLSATGIDKALREIEVVSESSGKPRLSFSGWTNNISNKRGISHLTVSISHTDNYAVAMVILTGQDTV